METNRIVQLKNILNEIRYMREYILPAIEKETLKGIDHIEHNRGKADFFFPADNYMEEKIGKAKDSVQYMYDMQFPDEQ